MTDRQKEWSIRNNFLWRLKGSLRGLNFTVCTKTEVKKVLEARRLIDEVIRDSIKSSIELGFDAKQRCTICGKPAPEGHLYCEKCYNEFMK